jgi:hypothetical protein
MSDLVRLVRLRDLAREHAHPRFLERILKIIKDKTAEALSSPKERTND